MNQYDLTGHTASSTYGRLVQTIGSSYYDGFGNLLNINATGSQGSQGVMGFQGNNGPQGDIGPAGISGDKYYSTASDDMLLPFANDTISMHLDAGLAYSTGMYVVVQVTDDPDTWFHARIINYDPETGLLELYCIDSQGVHIDYSTWYVNVSGGIGPVGRQGETGIQGNQGPNGNTGLQGPGFSAVLNYGTNRLLTSNNTSNQAQANSQITFNGNTFLQTQFSFGSTSPLGLLQGPVLDTHPESNYTTFIPFINNDLAFNRLRGGTMSDNATSSTTTLDVMFNGATDYVTFNTNIIPATYSLTVDFYNGTFMKYGQIYGVHFGNTSWIAKSIKLELYYSGGWVTASSVTGWGLPVFAVNYSANAANPISSMRWTFGDYNYPAGSAQAGSGFRIAQIWGTYYNSLGVQSTLLSKSGGVLYGDITPNTSGSSNLGTSPFRFNSGWFNNLYGGVLTTFRILDDGVNDLTFRLNSIDRIKIFRTTGNLVIGTSSDNGFALYNNGTSYFNGNIQIAQNSTGAGSAALGRNCPAIDPTTPYTWIKMISADGSTVYIPAYK